MYTTNMEKFVLSVSDNNGNNCNVDSNSNQYSPRPGPGVYNSGSSGQLSVAISQLDSLIEEMEIINGNGKEKCDQNGENGDDVKIDLEDQLDQLTNKLKNAMDTGVDLKESLGKCSKCNEEILEKSVLVGDQTYHEGCFLCEHCSTKLQGKYYQINGQNYCEDHKDINIPKCSVCSQSLSGEFVNVNGESLHIECFVCSVCGEQIKGRFFKDQETNKFLCIADYQAKADKCSKCNLPMTERILTYKDNQIHPDCFRCKNCDKSLDGVNYLEDQDEPVCAECYEELYAVKCNRCSKPLNMGDPDTKTKYIVCDNKNYHTSCYTCKKCNTSLENKRVYLDDNDIICSNCHDNINQ